MYFSTFCFQEVAKTSSESEQVLREIWERDSKDREQFFEDQKKKQNWVQYLYVEYDHIQIIE